MIITIYLKNIRIKYLIFLSIFLVTFSLHSQATYELGMNLSEVRDWSTAWVFVDRMKNARQWIGVDVGRSSSSGQTVPTGIKGYPLEIPYDPDGAGPILPQEVQTYLYINSEHYPEGTYTLIFEGTGKITLGNDATGSFTEANTPHQFEFTPPDQTLSLKIVESSQIDPIRNIRVIMPGFEDNYDTQIFHPLFLERLQGFKSIRFLFWGQVWGSQVETWDQVTPVDYYTQATDEGVAPEYMIALTNRLDADPYICIPYLADENYIRQLARLIRDNMNLSNKVYIEYGNEVWNGSHPEANYVRDQGELLGFSTDRYQAGCFYYAKRSAEVFQIFEQEFGGTDRIVRVAGGFAGNAWTALQILTALEDNSINPTSSRADVLAIAPYFGITVADDIANNNQVNTITVDEILDLAEASVYIDTAEMVARNYEYSEQFSIPLIAYEGGPHLVGTGSNMNNDVLTAKLIAANRDPRMEEIYSQMLSVWFNNGGELFTAFLNVEIYSKYGSWGMLEYQNQPGSEAPKFRAISQLLNDGNLATLKPIQPFNIKVRD